MTQIIDGNSVAGDIRGEITDCVETLEDGGVTPGLATVLMSDDPASETYVSMKQQDCEEVGIESHHVEIDPDAPGHERFDRSAARNTREAPNGNLAPLPVPSHAAPRAPHRRGGRPPARPARRRPSRSSRRAPRPRRSHHAGDRSTRQCRAAPL